VQLEVVGFEQLSWWHRVMIILPIRRRSGSVAMGGATTQVIRIVVSVGRTRAGVVLDGSSSRKVVISSSK
jgi:hypothetical protein